MLHLILVLAFLSQDPAVWTREPRPAATLVQSVRASCGGTHLLISGYGVARPLNRVPEVLVGGRPVTGADVRRLVADLSNRRAVYRLEILCGATGSVTVRLNEGEKQLEGGVRYRSGSALIRGNRLVAYSGLQVADAETFWFR